MTRIAASARAGMTLMELVIALVITGMIAGIGAAAFDSVLDNRASATVATHAVTRAAATRALLVSWMSSARFSSDAQRPPSATTLNLGEDDDALVVFVNTPTPIDYTEAVVHLFIDRDPATTESGLVAEMQSLEAATMVRTELDSTVTGLLVEYLDQQTNRWVPRKEGVVRSPLAMRMTLSARAPDTLPPLLRIPFVQAVPRAAGQAGTRATGGQPVVR
jgi:prepilin-type N-terminal cleavage/methylation domain-containing protein